MRNFLFRGAVLLLVVVFFILWFFSHEIWVPIPRINVFPSICEVVCKVEIGRAHV